MPLSPLDLVSTFFGRWSFGFSLWFAIPQIGLLYTEKPTEGGPRFTFLAMWLVGDVAQTVGLFAMGGLATQQASGVCFAVSSSVILIQRCYYRGLVPWTSYRRERTQRTLPVVRQLVAGVHRLPATAAAPYTPIAVHHERDKPGRRRLFPETTSRDRRRSHEAHAESRRSKTWWKEFDGSRFNLTGFCASLDAHTVVTVVMLVVWGVVDLARRDSTALHVEHLPAAHSLRFGWYLGWIGTVLYTAPRIYQLAWIVVEKSVSAISVFSFASLVLQNVTMLISILAASHTPDTVLAQSPYLTNVACALCADCIFLALHRLYRDRPAPPSRRPWCDPDWMYRDHDDVVVARARRGSGLDHRSTRSSRHNNDDDDAIHARYLPRVPVASPEHRPLPAHERRARRSRARTALAESEAHSIEAEHKWICDSESVPWVVRGKSAARLDRQAERERRELAALLAIHASGCGDDDEHAEWERNRVERVRELKRLRRTRTEMGYSKFDEGSGSSVDEDGDEEERDTSRARDDRRFDLAKSSHSERRAWRNSHPRRGVGTLSDEESSE